jgi:hypothetical protein
MALITRKMDPSEVAPKRSKGSGQRKEIELEYDRYLAEFNDGDLVEVILGDDDVKTNVRNRFKAAAKRLGLSIEIIRTKDDSLSSSFLPAIRSLTCSVPPSPSKKTTRSPRHLSTARPKRRPRKLPRKRTREEGAGLRGSLLPHTR